MVAEICPYHPALMLYLRLITGLAIMNTGLLSVNVFLRLGGFL